MYLCLSPSPLNSLSLSLLLPIDHLLSEIRTRTCDIKVPLLTYSVHVRSHKYYNVIPVQRIHSLGTYTKFACTASSIKFLIQDEYLYQDYDG